MTATILSMAAHRKRRQEEGVTMHLSINGPSCFNGCCAVCDACGELVCNAFPDQKFTRSPDVFMDHSNPCRSHMIIEADAETPCDT